MSFAEFERIATDNGDESGRAAKARDTYSRAYTFLKKKGVKDERVVLLDAWTDFEREYGTQETLEDVEAKAPRSVKKRRRLMDDQGQPAGWEEYIDYIFPDDEEEKPNLKLLAMAHQWKQKMAEMQGNSNGDKSGET